MEVIRLDEELVLKTSSTDVLWVRVLLLPPSFGSVVELAYTLDLKSNAARIEGSIPSTPIMLIIRYINDYNGC